MPSHVPLYRLAAEEEKNAVGGLLLLFCATRTIISPVYLLIQYYVVFSLLGGVGEHSPPPWIFLLVAVDVLLTALGVWAGVLIWKLRASGVRLAKCYLVLTVLYPLAIGVLLQEFGMGALAQQFGANVGTSLIFSTLWFIYLCTSERVKNLYEVDEARGTPPA